MTALPPAPPTTSSWRSRRHLDPRILWGAALACALLIAIVAVFQFRPSSDDSAVPVAALPSPAAPAATPAAPPGAPGPRAAATAAPLHGVFRGVNPSEVKKFGTWLGREPKYALMFDDSTTWSSLEKADWLKYWTGSSYRLVYSVPMLPTGQSASMATGAKGSYDKHFAALGRRLVQAGQADAILRVGWEFNIKNSHWNTKHPQDFIDYWKHIATVMRKVPGQKFEFDWNPVNGYTAYDATKYYPGDSYVDYVGIDVYDLTWTPGGYPYPKNCSSACRTQRQNTAWDYLMTSDRGLGFWTDFAAQHKKPVSLPEWALWKRPDGRGGADNPSFITRMHAYMADPKNNVAYQIYFDFDGSDGQHGLQTYLKSGGKAYKKLFGAS